jgi:hypothetical protein
MYEPGRLSCYRLIALSSREAAVLVAQLRSVIRMRDKQLTAMEHALNNEVATLQLVVHRLRSDSLLDADRGTLLDALARTTGRMSRLMDVFRK